MYLDINSQHLSSWALLFKEKLAMGDREQLFKLISLVSLTLLERPIEFSVPGHCFLTKVMEKHQ